MRSKKRKRKGSYPHLNWNVKCCALHVMSACVPIAILANRNFFKPTHPHLSLHASSTFRSSNSAVIEWTGERPLPFDTLLYNMLDCMHLHLLTFYFVVLYFRVSGVCETPTTPPEKMLRSRIVQVSANRTICVAETASATLIVFPFASTGVAPKDLAS